MDKACQRGGAVLALFVLLGLALAGQALALGQPVAPSAEEREALDSLKGVTQGEIVFSSRRDGKWRLFRVYSDGSHLVRLSSGIANHTRPVFVLGGSRLVYQSDEEGPVQIWMAEPDLSSPRRLSPPGRQEWFQGLSANGKVMLVARSRHKNEYFLRRLGSGLEVPVVFEDRRLGEGHLEATLSPDGRRLAYFYKDDAPGGPERGIYVVDLEPDGRTANTRYISDGCFVSWRADSQAFLASRFLTFRGGPGTEIWLCDLQGPREKLTRNLDWNYQAVFSPDEQWMAWAASPLYSHDMGTGKYDIHVKRLSDRSPVRLTFHTAPDMEPTWRAQRSRLPAARPDFVYEAEDFTHEPASVSEEGGASGGRVSLARQDAPKAGAVVYGQYDVLPAGYYVARFRLKLARPLGPGRVAELDVSVENGQRILAKREVLAEEFVSGKFRDFDLAFSSEQLLTALECRVSFFPGVADLLVDVITVKPAAPPPWYQPFVDIFSFLGN
ncbi:MAG: PD40 domain-containing protein [Desulfarculus sp.]|nr:PD40 domain-containing protein [Desulfarculus sp.]